MFVYCVAKGCHLVGVMVSVHYQPDRFYNHLGNGPLGDYLDYTIDVQRPFLIVGGIIPWVCIKWSV